MQKTNRPGGYYMEERKVFPIGSQKEANEVRRKLRVDMQNTYQMRNTQR
jgi:hypothetical protein